LQAELCLFRLPANGYGLLAVFYCAAAALLPRGAFTAEKDRYPVVF